MIYLSRFIGQNLQKNDGEIFDKLKPTITFRKFVCKKVISAVESAELLVNDKIKLMEEGVNICTNTPFVNSKEGDRDKLEHILNLILNFKNQM